MIVDFDPIALQIGSFSIRWYGLAYLAGFLCSLWWAKMLIRRISAGKHFGVSSSDIDDLMTYCILGVIIGGRLGQVIFYHPEYYFAHPIKILMVWEGGMAFHGGVLGVIFALYLFAKRRRLQFLVLGDLVCAGVPIGLFFGRLANFINGELWGRVTDVSWGMVFPLSGTMDLRHPSPLYEALLEGALLFSCLAFVVFYLRALSYPGRVAGLFLLGYGLMRSLVEFFREPDMHIGLIWGVFSWGQWLSVPMIIGGIWLIQHSKKGKEKNV